MNFAVFLQVVKIKSPNISNKWACPTVVVLEHSFVNISQLIRKIYNTKMKRTKVLNPRLITSKIKHEVYDNAACHSRHN